VTCSFEFAACNDDDIVTLNGEQVKFSMGSFPLESESICGVGSRVFMFILPQVFDTCKEPTQSNTEQMDIDILD